MVSAIARHQALEPCPNRTFKESVVTHRAAIKRSVASPRAVVIKGSGAGFFNRPDVTLKTAAGEPGCARRRVQRGSSYRTPSIGECAVSVQEISIRTIANTVSGGCDSLTERLR